MCTAKRFPVTLPGRNIEIRAIMKTLVNFVTYVGLPKSGQSGSGFKCHVGFISTGCIKYKYLI